MPLTELAALLLHWRTKPLALNQDTVYSLSPISRYLAIEILF